MQPEQYFLRYSFPCAYVLVEMGSISEDKLEELKQAVISNEEVSKSELMMIFPAAFRRLSEVASKMKKDVWDVDVIKKYFLEDHNMYIDAKDGNYDKTGKSFREFCKVHKAKVIKKEENILTVRYEDMIRNVLSDLLPEADVGDLVSIHQGFAVEKLE